MVETDIMYVSVLAGLKKVAVTHLNTCIKNNVISKLFSIYAVPLNFCMQFLIVLQYSYSNRSIFITVNINNNFQSLLKRCNPENQS